MPATVSGSVAVSLVVLVSPPPPTVTRLVKTVPAVTPALIVATSVSVCAPTAPSTIDAKEAFELHDIVGVMVQVPQPVVVPAKETAVIPAGSVSIIVTVPVVSADPRMLFGVIV